MATPTTLPAENAAEVGLGGGDPDIDIDNEIQELEQEMLSMEQETQQVKDLSDTADTPAATNSEDIVETDKRSVYVGNVDYGATPQELQEHFKSCGTINRITIMVDKFTCQPKGFAYMEFADEQNVNNAVLLNDSLFRGRQLKVTPKRTNVPGFNKGFKGKGKGKSGAWPPAKGKGKMGKYYDASWSYKGGKGKGKAPY